MLTRFNRTIHVIWRSEISHNDFKAFEMAGKDQGRDQKTHALYHKQGMGLRIPPGERPAVLVIDMQHDFCDLDAPTTLWPSIRQTYEPIKRLCTEARERKVPVIYTQGLVAADGSSVGLWRFDP